MKKLILLLLIFPSVVTSADLSSLNGIAIGDLSSWNGIATSDLASWNGVAWSSAYTCPGDWCETFEGTGYSSLTNPCGSAPCVDETGTPDEDFSTSGLSLLGDQCLRLDINDGITITVTAVDEIYILALFRHADAMEADEWLVRFYSSVTTLGTIYHESSTGNRFYPYAEGGTLAYTTETNSAGSSTYIKLRYKIGAGGDSITAMSVWTGTAWGSWASSSDGTSTSQVDKVFFTNRQNSTGVEYHYWDGIIYKATATDPFTAAPDTYYE
ncbi:hypothetical protein DSCO28_50300 [Desulfosarcina ovata subsp. sediminis]|uniref:Uncharacterized protein n=1 Tax=Desulfosarcina ovata subsp. sediminis TaxID=885957 RepID=A0A5K7ZWA6_9BACT|nr:hypothetical protein [Desulfosarcina ovata]BBO84464.1 hypothetical protein DSCO28_50300 [Desulfosarcina ovata subsp. sediminis]